MSNVYWKNKKRIVHNTFFSTLTCANRKHNLCDVIWIFGGIHVTYYFDDIIELYPTDELRFYFMEKDVRILVHKDGTTKKLN